MELENSTDLQAAFETQIKENSKLARQLRSLQDLVDRAKSAANANANLNAAISAEKANQEKFLKLLLQNSPDIILMFDTDNRFAYCTDAFLKRTSIADFGLINGRKFAEVFERLSAPGR